MGCIRLLDRLEAEPLIQSSCRGVARPKAQARKGKLPARDQLAHKTGGQSGPSPPGPHIDMANATDPGVASIGVTAKPSDGDQRCPFEQTEKELAGLVEAIGPVGPFPIEPIHQFVALRPRIRCQILEPSGLRRDQPTYAGGMV